MLTEKDRESLRILCLRIRFATARQLGNAVWFESSNPVRAARARLDLMRSLGLVEFTSLPVIELHQLYEPLASWIPNQAIPNLGSVAWQLSRRWNQQKRSRQLFFATRRAAQYFGGVRTGTIPNPFHVSHDLGVSSMFFAVAKTRPKIIRFWIDEDRLAPHRIGEKLPDAVLARAPNLKPFCVLEFGGAYSKARLKEFHEDNRKRKLPYEIW